MQKSARKGLRSFWTIILFLVLTVIVFLPALGEYYSSKRDFIKLWNEQGQLLSETILRSAARFSSLDRESQFANEQRLLDLGHYVRQMDSLYFPDKKKVMRFAKTHRGLRLFYCDAQGKIYGRCAMKLRRQLHEYISGFLEEHVFDKPVLIMPPLPGTKGFAHGVLISRAMNNEFILLLPMLRRFAPSGVGPPLQGWLNHLTRNSSIEYIALFRQQTILGSSGEIPDQIAIPDTPFPNWKIREQTNRNVFEYSRRDPEGMGVLIGLSTGALRRLQNNLIRRLIISSVIMLILGIVLFTYILKRHSFSLLKIKYTRIQTYSAAILENMDEAIILLNEQGRISIFNKAAQRLFALEWEQVKDKTVPEISLALPAQTILDILAEKTFLERAIEYDVGGDQKQLLISARPLYYSDENLKADKKKMYLIFIHDNTGQQELEEIRSRKNKLMAMGQLASRMAHEIRNPLNGIGMLAQRLSKEFTPAQEAEQFGQMTASIRSESSRINQIVETFLSYARNPEFKFSKTDLKKMIQDQVPLLQSLGKAPLEFEMAGGCEALVDADQFKQALINLVKNAFDVSDEAAPVKLSLQCADDKIILAIEDRGPGIAPEIKDKIFDLYFTTKEKGMGLGLSIVEKIISAHGGIVRVESPYFADKREQRGSRFIVELPRRELK